MLQVFINALLHCWHFPCCWHFCDRKKLTKIVPIVSESEITDNMEATPEEIMDSESDDIEAGNLLNSNGESFLKKRIVAGRGRDSSKMIKNSLSVSHGIGSSEQNIVSPTWTDCVPDIEITVSDTETNETQNDENKSIISTFVSSAKKRKSIFPIPIVPIARLLNVTSIIIGPKHSSAKMNLNKMGPGIIAAKFANLLAKIIMLTIILSFLSSYYLTVIQYL